MASVAAGWASLNRIAEAACAVARESNFRLTVDELAALKQFRAGIGTLEWAGIGLIFGPELCLAGSG